MSVALFIVPERDIEGFDPFVNGKFVGRENDKGIDQVCRNAGVKSLYDFCSTDPEEVADFIRDNGGEVPDELPAEEFFEAEEGLKTVRGMLGAIDENTTILDNPAGVIRDLKEYEVVLVRLQSEGIRWHMQVDF